MKQKYDIVVADPEGNITIFVLTKTPRSDYSRVAGKLLAIQEYKGEQVCFVLDDDRAEMCGFEFCGNASRSFGLLKAKKQGIQEKTCVTVHMSGATDPLDVYVEPETNYTRINMPIPALIEPLNLLEDAGVESAVRLDFDGITHIVLFDITADQGIFEKIKTAIQKKYDPPAIGVMFYDTRTDEMTPVVYVRDVDTTYFEGSCGSGTTAAAIALTARQEKPDGTYSYKIAQPAGTIASTVIIKEGRIEAVTIEGTVILSPVLSVEI